MVKMSRSEVDGKEWQRRSTDLQRRFLFEDFFLLKYAEWHLPAPIGILLTQIEAAMYTQHTESVRGPNVLIALLVKSDLARKVPNKSTTKTPKRNFIQLPPALHPSHRHVATHLVQGVPSVNDRAWCHKGWTASVLYNTMPGLCRQSRERRPEILQRAKFTGSMGEAKALQETRCLKPYLT